MIGTYIVLIIALMLNAIVVFIGENRDNALEERVEMLELEMEALSNKRAKMEEQENEVINDE